MTLVAGGSVGGRDLVAILIFVFEILLQLSLRAFSRGDRPAIHKENWTVAGGGEGSLGIIDRQCEFGFCDFVEEMKKGVGDRLKNYPVCLFYFILFAEV